MTFDHIYEFYAVVNVYVDIMVALRRAEELLMNIPYFVVEHTLTLHFEFCRSIFESCYFNYNTLRV